jgi:hypothetical protein
MRIKQYIENFVQFMIICGVSGKAMLTVEKIVNEHQIVGELVNITVRIQNIGTSSAYRILLLETFYDSELYKFIDIARLECGRLAPGDIIEGSFKVVPLIDWIGKDTPLLVSYCHDRREYVCLRSWSTYNHQQIIVSKEEYRCQSPGYWICFLLGSMALVGYPVVKYHWMDRLLG